MTKTRVMALYCFVLQCFSSSSNTSQALPPHSSTLLRLGLIHATVGAAPMSGVEAQPADGSCQAIEFVYQARPEGEGWKGAGRGRGT